MSEQGIRQVIRDELDRQADSGWSQLAVVPSTATWRAVNYLRLLPDTRRAQLREVLESAALRFFFEQPYGEPADLMQDPEYNQLVLAMVGAHEWNWAYASVRTLRSVLGGYRSKFPKIAAEFAATPPEVISRAEQLVPVRANELRKLVKAAAAARFGARPDNSGGGDWIYRGSYRGVDFVLAIDYGGYDQLRYSVSYADARSGIRATRLNYERLMGCGGTGWDSLTADNAAPSIELMCSFIETLVGIPERALSPTAELSGPRADLGKVPGQEDDNQHEGPQEPPTGPTRR